MAPKKAPKSATKTGNELSIFRCWQIWNLFEELSSKPKHTIPKDEEEALAKITKSGVMEYAGWKGETYQPGPDEERYEKKWLNTQQSLGTILKNMGKTRDNDQMYQRYLEEQQHHEKTIMAGKHLPTNDQDKSSGQGENGSPDFDEGGPCNHDGDGPSEQVDVQPDVRPSASDPDRDDCDGCSTTGSEASSEIARALAALDLQGKGDGPNGTDVDMDRWFEWWYERHCNKARQKQHHGRG